MKLAVNPVARECPGWVRAKAAELRDSAGKARQAYTSANIAPWMYMVADAYESAANLLDKRAVELDNMLNA